MKRALWFLGGLLVACAPRVDVNVFSIADVPNPVATRLDFVISAGDREAFLSTPPEPLPLLATLVLPDGFDRLSLHIELTAFIGEREIARGTAEVAPGQAEATIRFSVCSNGSPESLEACDDGNLIDADGCDSTCRPTGCASGVSTPGELCFAANDDLVGPDNPLQVLAGDIDGDELPDLVAPYSSLATPGVVRVFLNAPGGILGAFDEIPVPNLERIALGDLDGDGDLDAVASVHPPNEVLQVVILTNDGGAFSVGVGRQLSTLSISALALGDLDGDGLLDLFYTDKNTSRLLVNLGTGDGFGFQSQAINTGAQPIALQLADFDTDSDLDALTVNASGSVSVLVNSGGALTEKKVFTEGVPSALALGEFDTELGIDLAVTKQENGAGKVRLFKKVATEEVFQVVGDFELGTQPSALIAADLDLDGDTDLAATSQTESQIQVLFNNGGGQFDAPQNATGGLFDTRLGPVSLTVSDLNADGVPDLVAAGQNLGLLLSNP